MIVTTKMTMDLLKPGTVPVVYGVRNDAYCRQLELTLVCGGESWTVPEDAAVVVKYRKSDGTGGVYDTLPDGKPAWAAEGNVLTVVLAPQVLTGAGIVQLTVTLIREEVMLSTFGILLNVQEAVQEAGTESETYGYVTRFLTAPGYAEAGQVFRAAQVDGVGRVTAVEAVDPAGLFGMGEPGEGDLPRVFLTGEIPVSKEEVPAELEYRSRTEEFRAFVKIKCQGTSSMAYPKKNFTVELFGDEAREEKLLKVFRDWGGANHRYVLKANYVDHSHARNLVCARLWAEVVQSREQIPEKLQESPNYGAVDGFPVKLYTNGTYQGIYTWNIGKDAWLWGMEDGNPNHVLLCGEVNTNGVYGENACNFRKLWNGVDGSDWSVEAGSNSEAVKNSLNGLIGFVMANDGESFRNGIGEFLDVESALDYFLFSYVVCGLDNLAQNLLLGTYDGKTWICGQYDLDSTFGLWWDGSKFVGADYACPEDYQECYSLLWERIVKNYPEELKNRYEKLRKTVFSFSNLVAKFEGFMEKVGAENYAEDLLVYPGIPSGDSNNIRQIRSYIRDRLTYVDGKMAVLGEENESGSLPEGYTQVSYLQSDGNQYIDTGVTGGSDASYEITFNMLGVLAVNYEQYFAGDGENTAPKLFYLNGDSTVIAQCSNENTEGYWRLGWKDALTRTVRYDGVNGKLYVDAVEQTTYGYTPTNKYIGCGWGDTSWYVFTSPTEPALGASMQLYGLKMYSGGECIRDFVPVVRDTDGVAGLYDLVGQQFYGNAGSGSFEAGT